MMPKGLGIVANVAISLANFGAGRGVIILDVHQANPTKKAKHKEEIPELGPSQ